MICLTPVSPGTAVGTYRGNVSVSPSPSCPELFSPQQRTVPSESSAQLCPSALGAVILKAPVVATCATVAQPVPAQPISHVVFTIAGHAPSAQLAAATAVLSTQLAGVHSLVGY